MTDQELNLNQELPNEGEDDEGIQNDNMEGVQEGDEQGQERVILDEGNEEGERHEDGENGKEEVRKDDVERNHFVALKQERQKRQQIERSMRETQEKMQRMEQLFSKMQESRNQPEEDPIPSYEEDPLGHLTAKQKKLESYIEKQNQTEQQYQYQAQQQQKLQKVVNEYKNQAQEYAQENPDFKNAYAFLIQNRSRQYEAAGYNQNDISQLISEDELSIVSNAYQQGKNPAELLYEVAKASGYKSNSGSNDTLNQVKQGLKNNKSLSNKGTKSNSINITLEELSNMDPSDPKFDKYWEKLTGLKP